MNARLKIIHAKEQNNEPGKNEKILVLRHTDILDITDQNNVKSKIVSEYLQRVADALKNIHELIKAKILLPNTIKTIHNTIDKAKTITQTTLIILTLIKLRDSCC